MQSPLFASDQDAASSSTPLLSSEPAEPEQPELLSQLLAQTQQQQQQSHQSAGGMHSRSQPLHQFLPQRQHEGVSPSAAGVTTTRTTSIHTIAAATFSLLHLGLVWGAFLSNAWTETVVRVEVDSDGMDETIITKTIATTSLASFLQTTAAAKQYCLLILSWTGSLVVSCCFIILSPMWVVGDYQKQLRKRCLRRRSYYSFRSIRNWAQGAVRLGLLQVYAMVVVGMAVTVDLAWTDTQVEIYNLGRTGFAAYVTATAAALACVATLCQQRHDYYSSAPVRHLSTTALQQNHHHQQSIPAMAAARLLLSSTTEPSPSMRALEESPPPSGASPRLRRPSLPTAPDSPSTPDLVDEHEACDTTNTAGAVPVLYKLLVFELGVLAVLLWIPALYLPAWSIQYTGLASEFLMDGTKHRTVFLWQVGTTLWNNQDQNWIVVTVSAAVLMSTVLLVPVAVTCLSVTAWSGRGRLGEASRRWLATLAPVSSSLVWSIAILLTVPAVDSLVRTTMEDGVLPHGVCNGGGFAVHGKLLAGSWFLLAQAVVLEVFVAVTLRWS